MDPVYLCMWVTCPLACPRDSMRRFSWTSLAEVCCLPLSVHLYIFYLHAFLLAYIVYPAISSISLICLSVCLLYIFIPVCHISTYKSPSICMSVVCMSVCLYICYISIHLPAYLSHSLSCLSVYQ